MAACLQCHSEVMTTSDSLAKARGLTSQHCPVRSPLVLLHLKGYIPISVGEDCILYVWTFPNTSTGSWWRSNISPHGSISQGLRDVSEHMLIHHRFVITGLELRARMDIIIPILTLLSSVSGRKMDITDLEPFFGVSHSL